MPSLKEVKVRITSVMSTQQITKAMKMVAAAKLRKSQDRIIQVRPYAKKLSQLLQNLAAAESQGDQNWFSKARREDKILIVAISGDRGLCGAFNSNIFKATLKLIQDKYSAQMGRGNVTVLPLGKKAMDFFTKRNMQIVGDYWNVFPNLSFSKIDPVVNFLMDSFQAGKYDKIEIVFNEFKNVATQILRTEQFLPTVAPESSKEKTTPVDYIYQPGQDEIMAGLVPKTLKTQLFKAVLDSDAAFNGAQMTTMDKATENAGELLKELKLTYNRTRQAAITKEILEIVAGAEALKAS